MYCSMQWCTVVVWSGVLKYTVVVCSGVPASASAVVGSSHKYSRDDRWRRGLVLGRRTPG